MIPDHQQHARRLDVQGLRGLAVTAVVLFHTGTPGFTGGFVGVDVFFVVSGFLITGNLLRDHRAHGRVRLGRFFARRLVRLAPAAAATVVATVVAAHVLLPPLDRLGLRTEALASLFGLENLWLARTATDYLAEHAESPFQQFWSLGVEEQFYLVWAPIVAVLLCVRPLRRSLVGITAVGCALGFLVTVVSADVSGPWTFFGLHARVWELGVGALLAAAVQRRAHRRTPAPAAALRTATAAALPAGLLLIAASVTVFDATTPWPGPWTVLPVVGAALVLAPVPGSPLLRRALGSRPLTWIGDRSYSIYLVHWPVLVLWEAATGRPRTLTDVLLALTLTTVLGWVWHALLERGVERLVRTGSVRAAKRGPVTVLAGVAVVAAAVVPATALPELTGERPAPAATSADVLRGPHVPRGVPSNLVPSLEAATESLPPVYADGCHAGLDATTTRACRFGGTGPSTADPDDDTSTVVLLGDSHAAQWVSPFRTLVADRGAELVTMTKSSCPGTDLSVDAVELGRPYRECDAWRRDALRRIDALRPDVVVVADAANSYPDDADPQEWGAALRRTVARLRSAGAEVVVLGDTPFWPETPNRCLSASLDDVATCGAPVDAVTERARASAQRTAAGVAGADFVDPVPWICSDRCQPVLWNVLVYRDTNHITDEMARALTPRLDRAVGPLLP